MEDYKFLFKIVLIGNAGVGKTCLVRRFTQGVFPGGQGATIGVDFMIKTLLINGTIIRMFTTRPPDPYPNPEFVMSFKMF
ncbi:unnamed protein product [Oppiella nova]|uniref:Ras-related protein Rab-30 n=1 Tax=Oppiella nova TaxID=334625 RepID=A0A7R9QVH0_9ACAR|nr:unnamed protein product [Oppiella nova]CAG2175479.1 unnamed protein product [Oppiella nova]